MSNETTIFAKTKAKWQCCMVFLVLSISVQNALADPLSEIRNFFRYSETFASAGQPNQDQLAQLRDAGFERIIYIALSNSNGALAHEDELVKSLGMDYVHLPVVWSAPSQRDFEVFSTLMRGSAERKTLLHCQANFRASAFALLYRVIYLGEPLASAKADMDTIWTPDVVWRDFIFETLRAASIDPQCDGCDWTPAEY